MDSAICNLTMIPVRAEPSDRSEMTTQLLFGELFTINRQEGGWLHITCDYDGYQGWIDYKQCRLVSDQFTEVFKSSPSPVCYDLLQIVFNETRKIAIPVCLGSTLPNYTQSSFYVDEDRYEYDGQFFTGRNITRDMVCKTAMMYLNSPYLWGGRSPFGIDCSGLVQMVFRINGYRLKRDAAMMSAQGTQVSFAGEAEPGDIAFFENEFEEITHTGIILHGNKIIHSSGRVRIDDFDHEGIFNKELGKYTHKLRLINSVI